MPSEPFDIHRAMDRIRERMQAYPKAAMFELAEEGYRSVFEMLLACIISIRTLDEVTLIRSRVLFAAARTPEQLDALEVEQIEALIRPSQFSERKARQMKEIAGLALRNYGGELPCEVEALTALPGVGIKCAHLALAIACGMPFIGVDAHVHRVVNRWGYIQTRSPEMTTRALEEVLPKEYWVEINQIGMPFGKHICTWRRPKCSTCPVESMCPRVGVTAHR